MAIMKFPLSGWWNALMGNPQKGAQLSTPGMVDNPSNARITDDRAIQLTAVFSCMRLLSESVGLLPMHVYRRGEDRRTREQNHWIVDLMDEPNEVMTGAELREVTVLHLAGWGNAYWLKDKTSDGKRVTGLWPLQPNGMKVERDGRNVSYKYTSNQGEETYSADDICHIKGFGNDGFIGLSPLGLAREAIGLAVSAEVAAARFYGNGGRPTGHYTTDQILKQNQREELRKIYGGGSAWDSNEAPMLEAGFKYTPISISPEDSQLLESRSFQVAEIARIFRVPLHLLMSQEKGPSWAGSGLEQQNLAYLTYTLAPYLVRIERAVRRRVLPREDRKALYLEHSVEGLLRADSKARAEFLSTMVNNGIMDRNEARGKENLAPRDGADKLTVQSALTPLDTLGQPDPLTNALGRALTDED